MPAGASALFFFFSFLFLHHPFSLPSYHCFSCKENVKETPLCFLSLTLNITPFIHSHSNSLLFTHSFKEEAASTSQVFGPFSCFCFLFLS